MIPTGQGKVGMRVETPDGDGVITQVHNQDNVTVKLDRVSGRKDKDGNPIHLVWVGDVNECTEKAKEKANV